MNDATKTATVRVWDGSTVHVGSYTAANNVALTGSYPWVIGTFATDTTRSLTALLDEVVVFKRALSNTDIDAIRSGTFGAVNYSRGAVTPLPTDDADLGTIITDKSPLASADGNRIGQAATGEYAIFLFKDTVTASSVTLTFTGRADLAPSSSSVVLQVYKYSGGTPGWETPAWGTENSVGADTDFTITGNIPDTTNYLSSGVMAHRVYQLMT